MWGQDSISEAVFRFSQLAGGTLPAGNELSAVEQVQVFHPAWFFFLLFVFAGFLAWIRSYYGNVIIQTFQASTNYQVAIRMFRDNSLLQKQLDQALYLFYFLSMSFLLLLLETGFHLQPYGLNGINLFFFNLAFLVGIFLARIVLLNVAGFLFDRVNLFREYLYNIFIFNKLAGICVLPLLPLMAYTGGWIRDIFHWTGIVVVLLIVLLRVARSIVFSFKKDISIFYLFVYLCALETVPLILLYRWIEGVL